MESPALGLSLVGLPVVAALILTNAFFVATDAVTGARDTGAIH